MIRFRAFRNQFWVTAVFLLLPGEVFARTWTDSTGKHKIEADFVSLDEGLVTLRTNDGRTLEMRLSKLSGRDREFVRKVAKQGEVQAATPAGAKAEAAREDEPTNAAPNGTDLQTVVAEGVGTSADEALKDAFRNAVRQVVGAVVDAETLVKNDELIDDKVLTYSDGLVKHYEEMKNSKDSSGMHRIKIKAQVQRRSLVAKLKAANVTVSAVDGKGLFAEVITDLDAAKDAEALVAKAFDGFPLNCLKTEVTGKPAVKEKTASEAKIAVALQFGVDMQGYGAFSKRLRETLRSVAKENGAFSLVATKVDTGTYHLPPGIWSQNIRFIGKQWESDPYHPGEQRSRDVVVAVATHRTKLADRTEWQFYVLDESVRTPLAATASCLLTTTLSLLDANDELVARDRFPAVSTAEKMGYPWYHASLLFPRATGRLYRLISSYGLAPEKAGFNEGYCRALRGVELDNGREKRSIKSPPLLFLVCPMFFYCSDNNDAYYVPILPMSRQITLSLEELRQVEKVKCELGFDGPLPPAITKGGE